MGRFSTFAVGEVVGRIPASCKGLLQCRKMTQRSNVIQVAELPGGFDLLASGSNWCLATQRSVDGINYYTWQPAGVKWAGAVSNADAALGDYWFRVARSHCILNFSRHLWPIQRACPLIRMMMCIKCLLKHVQHI